MGEGLEGGRVGESCGLVACAGGGGRGSDSTKAKVPLSTGLWNFNRPLLFLPPPPPLNGKINSTAAEKERKVY